MGSVCDVRILVQIPAGAVCVMSLMRALGFNCCGQLSCKMSTNDAELLIIIIINADLYSALIKTNCSKALYKIKTHEYRKYNTEI